MATGDHSESFPPGDRSSASTTKSAQPDASVADWNRASSSDPAELGDCAKPASPGPEPDMSDWNEPMPEGANAGSAQPPMAAWNRIENYTYNPGDFHGANQDLASMLNQNFAPPVESRDTGPKPGGRAPESKMTEKASRPEEKAPEPKAKSAPTGRKRIV